MCKGNPVKPQARGFHRVALTRRSQTVSFRTLAKINQHIHPTLIARTVNFQFLLSISGCLLTLLD